MPSAVLEPTIPAIQRLQTHAIDSTATGSGQLILIYRNINITCNDIFKALFILIIFGVFLSEE